jgi:hypothetical protein
MRRVSAQIGYAVGWAVVQRDHATGPYDAFGDFGTIPRELEWKPPIFSWRAFPKTPNAPQVLSLMGTIVNTCKDAVTPRVPEILSAVFECTLAMCAAAAPRESESVWQSERQRECGRALSVYLYLRDEAGCDAGVHLLSAIAVVRSHARRDCDAAIFNLIAPPNSPDRARAGRLVTPTVPTILV